jgi:hypothetical protein
MEMIAITGGEDGSWMVDRKIDCWIVDMLDCEVRDIMGLNLFPWLELSMNN